MNLSPERFQEMCVQNDAELKMLYAMRCWVRQEIEFRERLKTEWLRASPLRGRACALRAEPPAESQAEPLVPDADIGAPLGSNADGTPRLRVSSTTGEACAPNLPSIGEGRQ